MATTFSASVDLANVPIGAGPQLVPVSLTSIDPDINIVSFTPDRVTVDIDDDGTTATIVIRDDGPGLAPEVLQSAFEPGVTTKSPGPVGRGLGLSLVRRAATALGGDVTVRNDGGAVFTVTLPHAAQPALT